MAQFINGKLREWVPAFPSLEKVSKDNPDTFDWQYDRAYVNTYYGNTFVSVEFVGKFRDEYGNRQVRCTYDLKKGESDWVLVAN